MLSVLPVADVRRLQPGASILYRNRYDQLLTGRIVGKRLDDYGRLFFFVKRPEWPREECLPFSDFERGEYVVLD